ncbi:MAG: hypothetical protein ACLU6B_06485 [Lachnospirales bacterium]
MSKYEKQIRLRIGCIIVFLAVMIFFMVLSGELGWGDSRYMTSLMRTYSSLAFFGCLIYLIVCLTRYRKLLHNRALMEESKIYEQDEREQMIHDKSGGILADWGIPCIMIANWFAAMLAAPQVFYTLTIILIALAGGKWGLRQYYKRKYS